LHFETYGLDIVLGAYQSAFINLKKKYDYNFLIDYNQIKNKVTLNQPFLGYILNELEDKEDGYFRYVLKKNNAKKYNIRKSFVSMLETSGEYYVPGWCPYSPQDNEFKYRRWMRDMLFDREIKDTIGLGYGDSDEWKFKYYSQYFECNEYYKDMANLSSFRYLEGLIWNIKYYFEGCPCYSWFYPFTHTPFVSDLADYLSKSKKLDLNKIKFKDNITLSPCQQLLAVVPAYYASILPKSYQPLVKSGSPLEKYYPIDYKIDYQNRFKNHEAIPLIKDIDSNEIIYATKKLSLTKQEKIRDLIGTDFVFKS